MIVWTDLLGNPNATLSDNSKIRIVYEHYPYSYGTESYRTLQLLTKDGWKNIQSINYKRSNEKSSEEKHDKALSDLKDYANYLFI